MKKNILLAVESLRLGNGGISRVARLMFQVLVDEFYADAKLNTLVLSDTLPNQDIAIPIAVSKASRPHFLYSVHKAALTHSYFIYDSLGMARAHCRVPLLCKPFMTWIHGHEVWENTRPVRLKWARRANLLVSNTAYTREQAEHFHGGFAHAQVCWLATQTDELPTISPKTNTPPTVLIISRINEYDGYKGHKELIECWPKVLSCVPDARLIVIGKGSGLPLLKNLAVNLRVAKQIEFRGFLLTEKIEDILAETNVFAMPSRSEGFGLVYIEAMRYGLPVIASIHDAAPEINLDNETGYNVNLDKEDELTERLIFLLKNPEVAMTLGRKGQQRWFEHFRYSAFRKRFTPLLHKFLENDTLR
jgi:phosphatidylinositol alpha-1,6-mannosyltransferase